MPSSKSHASVYMRGLYDGLKEGMSSEMTPTKHKLALEGMSTICKKIFEYVPQQEAWSASKILTAMSRSSSTRPPMNATEGCLNSLKESGLVKETERGLFQQVVPRTAVQIAVPKLNQDALADEKPSGIGDIHATVPVDRDAVVAALEFEPCTPAESFGGIATALRLKGQSLIRLADEIESAALAFEQQIEDGEKRLARFNQLKALLTEA